MRMASPLSAPAAPQGHARRWDRTMRHRAIFVAIGLLATVVTPVTHADDSTSTNARPLRVITNGNEIVFVDVAKWKDTALTMIFVTTNSALFYTVGSRSTEKPITQRLTDKELKSQFPELHQEMIRALCGANKDMTNQHPDEKLK